MFRLTLLLLLAPGAVAQIVTDRPDLTESTGAVTGLQIETGFRIETTSNATAGDVTVTTGPNALVRIGLMPGVEVRVGLPDYTVVERDGRDGDGFADPSLGVKAELGALAGWDLAAIVEVSLPFGDDPFSTPASPLGILIVGRDLDGVSLGGQAEVLWDRDAERLDVGGTAVVGISLGEQAGVFAEIAGASTNGGAEVLAQGGATFLASQDVQLDAFVGAGLTDLAPDVFGGVGFSARF